MTEVSTDTATHARVLGIPSRDRHILKLEKKKT